MKEKTGEKESDGLETYISRIRAIPLLAFEEELELSRMIKQGDKAARVRLIEGNLRLVVKIARSYLVPDISLMDLVQEGNIGLIRAVEKYDFRRHLRFSTYAAWWIRQSVTRFMTSKRRPIRLPQRKEENLGKIQKAYHTLSQLYTRPPKAGEIAAETGLSKKDVEILLKLAHDLLYLESGRTVSRDGEEEVASVIELQEDYTYSPERNFIKKSSKEATRRLLTQLKDRERSILMYRYQLNGEERYTLKRIGDKMGISTETVRQIELNALKKIREQAGAFEVD